MWAYAKCSALRSAINMEKFETTRKGGSVHICALVPMSVGSAQQAHALVALSLSYLSPPARSFVLFIHGDNGCVCGVCVYGLGVLCAQPSQVGDAHVRHGRGPARRGKLQPIIYILRVFGRCIPDHSHQESLASEKTAAAALPQGCPRNCKGWGVLT